MEKKRQLLVACLIRDNGKKQIVLGMREPHKGKPFYVDSKDKYYKEKNLRKIILRDYPEMKDKDLTFLPIKDLKVHKGKQWFKEFDDNMNGEFEDVEISLDQVVYFAVLLKNDLHYVHLHASGRDFDDVHQITQELYEELEKEIDELSEMAISEGFHLGNFNDVRSYIPQDIWEAENSETYNYDDMVEVLSSKLGLFLEALNSTKVLNVNDKKYVNDIKYLWNKQLNYKNSARELLV